MEPILITPRFEILNRYFQYFDTKEEYIEEWELSYEDELKKTSDYERYKEWAIDRYLTKLKDILTDIERNEILTLCYNKHLSLFASDILFALAYFKNQLPGIDQSLTFNDWIKWTTIENLQLLRAVYLCRNGKSTLEINIVNPRDRKDTTVISDRDIFRTVLKNVEDKVIEILGSSPYNDIGLIEDISDVTSIELAINRLQKSRTGRKPTRNPKIAEFLINLLAYIESETSFRSGKNGSISNPQCRFFADLLSIMGLLIIPDEHEEITNQPKKESIKTEPGKYIRSLINNEKTWRKRHNQ